MTTVQLGWEAVPGKGGVWYLVVRIGQCGQLVGWREFPTRAELESFVAAQPGGPPADDQEWVDRNFSVVNFD